MNDDIIAKLADTYLRYIYAHDNAFNNGEISKCFRIEEDYDSIMKFFDINPADLHEHMIAYENNTYAQIYKNIDFYVKQKVNA